MSPSMPHCGLRAVHVPGNQSDEGLRAVQASMHRMPWPCLQRAATVFCICFLHTLQSVRPIGKPWNQVSLIPLHSLL